MTMQPISARYAAARKITLPLLMDPENQVMQRFRVAGIPKSFLYDQYREGHLAGQTLDRPGVSGWNELLTLVVLHRALVRRPVATNIGHQSRGKLWILQAPRDRCGAFSCRRRNRPGHSAFASRRRRSSSVPSALSEVAQCSKSLESASCSRRRSTAAAAFAPTLAQAPLQ